MGVGGRERCAGLVCGCWWKGEVCRAGVWVLVEGRGVQSWCVDVGGRGVQGWCVGVGGRERCVGLVCGCWWKGEVCRAGVWMLVEGRGVQSWCVDAVKIVITLSSGSCRR